jgi:hypothetical protein
MTPVIYKCEVPVFIVQGRFRMHRRFTKRSALRVYAWERLKANGRIERPEPEVGYDGNYEDICKITARFARFWGKRAMKEEK